MKAQFEKVTMLPENSFKVFLHEVDEFDAPWHYHPEFELTLILQSDGMRYVGNHVENFSKDDLVLVGPDLPHCWKNLAADERPTRAIVVQWSEQFLGLARSENPEFSSISRLLKEASQGITFKPQVSEQARPMIDRLLYLSPFDRLIQFLEILNLLATTTERQILCSQGFIYPRNHEDNLRINAVYNFVRTNYHEKITLSRVSELVHMSEESFSRFFSKIMQKPFFTFLNEYRITMACKLLIESDMQVTEICYFCGYESLPFFYRQFSKFRQVGPGSYRKQFQLTGER